MNDPAKKMPMPDTMLVVDVVGNDGKAAGGAAMLGRDGRWYWTHDRKKADPILQRVAGWIYLDPDPRPEPDPDGTAS